MSALGQLAAAGARHVPDLGERVAYVPTGAPPAVLEVAEYLPRRVAWRLRDPGTGASVIAAPADVIRLGRPHALELAAMMRPLHLWDRGELVEWLELPAGAPCGECGRPRVLS